MACERPNSPDFKVDHRVQTPVVLEREYKFLGASGALIDTTSADFDSLFTIDSEGLVTLSREEDLTFPNLGSVIPAVTAASTQINSVVGDIVLDDFSSQAQLGTASFQQVSGQGSDLNQGDPIPGGSTPSAVNITLDTDYFVSATLSTNGTLTLTVRNDLGFDADGSPGVTIDLLAGNTVLDTDSKDVPDNSTADFTFNLTAGTVLSNLNIDVSASWNAQNMSRDAGQLVVEDLQASNLEASQVQAVVSSQDFSSSGQSSIDNTEFEMTDPGHYIELESGQIHIHQIVNSLDLDVDQLVVSFPDIRSAPYTASDSLVIQFQGATAIPRNSSNAVEQTEPLAGYRVYGQNDVIDYNVSGLTENAQQGSGSQVRTIQNTDNVQATVDIENLQVAVGFGILKPRDVIMNDDDPTNGIDLVDVLSDDEAEVISVGGLDVLSEKIGSLEFANPSLTFNYETNIGSPVEIFSTLAATNGRGDLVFLHGTSGSSYEVGDAEAPNQLTVNGAPAGGSRMIKFSLDTTWAGTINRSEVFDRTNSNLDEFFNIIPSEMRLISDASINSGSAEGVIRNPVILNPSVSIDLPMNITSAGTSFQDTIDGDLSDLPGEGDDSRLIEAGVNIDYTNGLPLGFDLNLAFLDSLGQEITSVPVQGGDPLEIQAAPIDPSTRYVEQPVEGVFVIGLNEQQMEMLNHTRDIRLRASFSTTNQENVRIRAEDSITFTIAINVEIETSVN